MTGARAWCRVDLGGGTLDIWPLGLLHREARTVNVAIDLAVSVEIRPAAAGYEVRQGASEIRAADASGLLAREETALVGQVVEELRLPPVGITLASASPRGGGLGASSAMAVALLAAAEKFTGRAASPPQRLAALARDLEARLMRLPTGLQDHYAALLGGALEIRHAAGETAVRRLEVDLAALGDSLIVAYTGTSHFSAGNNWEVVRRRLDGDAPTGELLEEICAVAAELPGALEAGDLERVGGLLSREWESRRRLHAAISTPRIETLLELARSLGAWGGKACGAGGGGSLAVVCPPGRRRYIAGEMAARGAAILDTRPISTGLVVEEAA